MTFFNTFNSGVVEPAQVSYTSIALSANVTLNWPNLDATGNFTANIVEVTPSAGSLSITMPDATQRSPGQQILFRNMTGTAFTVKDNSGGTISNIAANTAIFIYLTTNATAAGSWSLVTFGTGTSSADSASLAGFGLKAIGITLNQAHPVLETTSNITIDSTYRAQTVAWTTGSLGCALPTAASVGADFFFIAKNAGTGSITFTPSGADTIDGAASLVLAPNDAAMIFSSGSSAHWYTVGIGRSVNFAFTQLVKNVAGGTDVTLTSSECSNKVMTFTGLLTANINVIVTNTVSVYYVFNNTSGAFTLTVKTAAGTGFTITQGAHDILICDATNVNRAVTNTAATTAFATGSAPSPSITFVGDTDTGLYEPAPNQVGVSAGGVNVGTFTSAGLSATGLTASGAVALSPSNLNVVLSPTGTGVVTINPATIGSIDNVTVGASTPSTVKATQLNISAAVGKIIPGATSLSHRNNADNADNLLITDAGAVTVRTTLTATTSVVAPIVDSGSGSLVLKGAGTTAITITGSAVSFAVTPSGLASLVRSYLAGCTLSTAGASTTMSISAGQATDDTNVSMMSLAAIAKTTSAWAVGTATGGLDTGSIAANTWYHFYVIQRPDTGVVDALLSLSASSPTMPTNYTLKRRIGSGRTNGSSQWTSFTQDGDYFIWATSVLDINSNNPGTAAVTRTLTVPTGVNVEAHVQGVLLNTDVTNNASLYLSDLAQTDETISTGPLTLSDIGLSSTSSGSAGQLMSRLRIRTNTSAQIRSKVGAFSSAAVTVFIRTLGWFDTRGKNS